MGGGGLLPHVRTSILKSSFVATGPLERSGLRGLRNVVKTEHSRSGATWALENAARARFRGHCASKSMLEVAFEATVRRNRCSSSLSRPAGRSKALLELAFEATVHRNQCSRSLSRPLCVEIGARARFRGDCASKSLLELTFEAPVHRNHCSTVLSLRRCFRNHCSARPTLFHFILFGFARAWICTGSH
jgi:hypothetical protein